MLTRTSSRPNSRSICATSDGARRVVGHVRLHDQRAASGGAHARRASLGLGVRSVPRQRDIGACAPTAAATAAPMRRAPVRRTTALVRSMSVQSPGLRPEFPISPASLSRLEAPRARPKLLVVSCQLLVLKSFSTVPAPLRPRIGGVSGARRRTSRRRRSAPGTARRRSARPRTRCRGRGRVRRPSSGRIPTPPGSSTQNAVSTASVTAAHRVR